jgi:uncharacterized repeat protein (TIGR03803 family)
MKCITYPAAMLSLICAFTAFGADSYDPATHQLMIPSLAIGLATYANVVVKVGTIISGPTGTSPNGPEDSYDPGNRQLTVQSVTVGAATYHNVVVPVLSLDSIQSVSGADTYNGSSLAIAFAELGGTIYDNVVVTVGGLVGIGGGMPTLAVDTYHGSSNQLQIPAVQVGNQVRTNVVITVGSVKSVAGIYSNVAEPFLYSFSGDSGLPNSTDGAQPQASLIQGSDGNFYGVTVQGGANNAGSVIRITPAGVETVLYSFSGGGLVSGSEDGAYPEAALIEGSEGVFYGTTYGGGTYEEGTVFQVTSAGIESVLHSFSGRGLVAGVDDGAEPHSALIRGSNGNFYGTTIQGGATGANPVGGGSGTVFEINAAGDEAILYSFTGGVGSSDGLAPYANLLLGSDGNFYGTTWMGGAYGLGSVFKVTAAGAETLLYSFCAGGIQGGCPDGSSPQSAMIQASDGNYYGTTESGGAYPGGGSIFQMTPNGSLSVFHSFSGDGEIAGSNDGFYPVAGPIEGSDGNLYGTTNLGGTYSRGAVYRISLSGEETVLHSFGGADNGLSGNGDGAQPLASLLQGSDGNFYGTTEQGGAHAVGSIFMLTNVVPAR